MSRQNFDQQPDPVKTRERIKATLYAAPSVKPSDLLIYFSWYDDLQRDGAQRELIGGSGEMDRKVLQYFRELEAPSTLDEVFDLVNDIQTVQVFWPDLDIPGTETINVYREQAVRLFSVMIDETLRKAQSQSFLDVTHLPSRCRELCKYYNRLVSTFDLSSDLQHQLEEQLPSDEQIAEYEKRSTQAARDEHQEVADFRRDESVKLAPVEQLFWELTFQEIMLLREILYNRDLERLYLGQVQRDTTLYQLITKYMYPNGNRDGSVSNKLSDL